jgi:hypothetical protein
MRFRRSRKRSAADTTYEDDPIRDAWIAAGMEPSGTCVGCFRETDTGTGFVGPAAFAIAALITVGVEQDVAVTMVSLHCQYVLGCRPGNVPKEDITYTIRLCSECAKGHFTVGPIAEGVPLPGVRAPELP